MWVRIRNWEWISKWAVSTLLTEYWVTSGETLIKHVAPVMQFFWFTSSSGGGFYNEFQRCFLLLSCDDLIMMCWWNRGCRALSHLEEVLTPQERPEVPRALQLPSRILNSHLCSASALELEHLHFPIPFPWNRQQLHVLQWVGAIEDDRRPMNKTQTCLFCAVLSKWCISNEVFAVCYFCLLINEIFPVASFVSGWWSYREVWGEGCKLGWFGVCLLYWGSHLKIVTALCQLQAGPVFVGFQSVLPLLWISWVNSLENYLK